MININIELQPFGKNKKFVALSPGRRFMNGTALDAFTIFIIWFLKLLLNYYFHCSFLSGESHRHSFPLNSQDLPLYINSIGRHQYSNKLRLNFWVIIIKITMTMIDKRCCVHVAADVRIRVRVRVRAVEIEFPFIFIYIQIPCLLICWCLLSIIENWELRYIYQ